MRSQARSRALDRFADEERAVRDPELRAMAAQARLDVYARQFAAAGIALTVPEIVAWLERIGEGASWSAVKGIDLEARPGMVLH